MKLTLTAEYDPSLQHTIEQRDLERMAFMIMQHMRNGLTVETGESVDGKRAIIVGDEMEVMK